MSDSTADATLSVGVVDARYESVFRTIIGLAAEDPHWAFQVVVHDRSGIVIDVASDETFRAGLVPVASVSKGIAGLALAILVERRELDPEARVARYWPEFAAAGKGSMTVADALSHRAGLLSFAADLRLEQMAGPEGAADLAGQQPVWATGVAHGYHAFTIGTLADELVRRVTGVGTAELFDATFRVEHGVEAWLRLPGAELSRLREVVASPAGPAPFAGSLSALAASPFAAFDDAPFWLNSRRLIESGVCSVSGVASARGIADAYATAVGVGGRRPLLSEATIARVSQIRSAGRDLVLDKPTRFGLMFQKPDPGLDFGSAAAFGHDGAGGGLGFADPFTGVAFGYLTGDVPTPSRVDERALTIARGVREIAIERVRT